MTEPNLYVTLADGLVSNYQRLVAVWIAFITDAVFSLCNYWSSSLPLKDMRCPLPEIVSSGLPVKLSRADFGRRVRASDKR